MVEVVANYVSWSVVKEGRKQKSASPQKIFFQENRQQRVLLEILFLGELQKSSLNAEGVFVQHQALPEILDQLWDFNKNQDVVLAFTVFIPN